MSCTMCMNHPTSCWCRSICWPSARCSPALSSTTISSATTMSILEDRAVHAARQPYPARHPRSAVLGEAGAVPGHDRRLRRCLQILHRQPGNSEGGSPRATGFSTISCSTNGTSTRSTTFLFVNPAKRLGYFLWKRGDGWLIDGFGPDGVSARVIDLTNRAVKLQSGYLYHYAFAMLIGVAALVTWMMLGSSF